MKIIENRSIREKLALIALFPVVGMLIFSAIVVLDKDSIKNEMDTLTQVAKLAVLANQLVHNLQKERGLSAGYLGGADTFLGQLTEHWRSTDSALNELKRDLDLFDRSALLAKSESTLDNSLAQLTGLRQVRDRVSNRSMNRQEMVRYYTQINESLLRLTADMPKLSSDTTIASVANAYGYFLEAKERAGIERAILSSAFSENGFSEGEYARFSTLVTEQETFLNLFKQTADSEILQFYNDTITGKEIEETNRMRSIALSTGAKSFVISELE